jgi:hypothetical protein
MDAVRANIYFMCTKRSTGSVFLSGTKSTRFLVEVEYINIHRITGFSDFVHRPDSE